LHGIFLQPTYAGQKEKASGLLYPESELSKESRSRRWGCGIV